MNPTPQQLERRISALETMLTQLLMDKYGSYDQLQLHGTPAEKLFANQGMKRVVDGEMAFIKSVKEKS